MAVPLTTAAAAARYRALFQSAADPILVADENGHYVDANPAPSPSSATPLRNCCSYM